MVQFNEQATNNEEEEKPSKKKDHWNCGQYFSVFFRRNLFAEQMFQNKKLSKRVLLDCNKTQEKRIIFPKWVFLLFFPFLRLNVLIFSYLHLSRSVPLTLSLALCLVQPIQFRAPNNWKSRAHMKHTPNWNNSVKRDLNMKFQFEWLYLMLAYTLRSSDAQV